LIRSLYLSPQDQLQSNLSSQEVRQILAGGEGVLWVDISGLGERERLLLSDPFQFHYLAIEDCFDGSVDTPKVDVYGSYLFVVSQFARYDVPRDSLELSEVDLFLGRNYVLSVHPDPVPLIDELIEHARVNTHLLNRGADFLAHTILDGLVDLLLPAVEALDDALDELEQRILEDPDKRLLADVLRLKRTTLRMRRSILPQRDLVNRIARGEFGDLIGSEALIFFRDIYDHVIRVEEMIEGLRDLADSALSSYLSSVNNRMNEIMKTLSIVSVIFLPLTLIASVYGTNLDFSPGVEVEGGFFLMLAAMAALSLVLILYFRKRRWF
jgi:magnesium transporter